MLSSEDVEGEVLTVGLVQTLGVRKFFDDVEKCSSDPEKHFLAYVSFHLP